MTDCRCRASPSLQCENIDAAGALWLEGGRGAVCLCGARSYTAPFVCIVPVAELNVATHSTPGGAIVHSSHQSRRRTARSSIKIQTSVATADAAAGRGERSCARPRGGWADVRCMCWDGETKLTLFHR